MTDFVIPKNYTKLMKDVETPFLKTTPIDAKVGDSIKIGFLIKEGNKERTQYYDGVIIAQKNSSINKTIIVRRVLQGIGIERIFLIHSPKIVSFKLTKLAAVRRSKLYYLRGLSGKASRLKQRYN